MLLPAMSRPRSGPSSLLGFLVLAGATAVVSAAAAPATGVADPRAVTTANPAGLQPWIAINRFGIVTTVTPSVTVDGKGATSTVSPFPGTPTSAPKVEADGSAVFLKCPTVDGTFTPFCTPDETSVLETGTTYISKLPRTRPSFSSSPTCALATV